MRNTSGRRRSLRSAAALVASAALPAAAIRIDEGGALFNPCAELSETLRAHELTQVGFANLNMMEVWKCHAHRLGMGESGSGAWVSGDMKSPWNIRRYAQCRFPARTFESARVFWRVPASI